MGGKGEGKENSPVRQVSPTQPPGSAPGCSWQRGWTRSSLALDSPTRPRTPLAPSGSEPTITRLEWAIARECDDWQCEERHQHQGHNKAVLTKRLFKETETRRLVFLRSVFSSFYFFLSKLHLSVSRIVRMPPFIHILSNECPHKHPQTADLSRFITWRCSSHAWPRRA